MSESCIRSKTDHEHQLFLNSIGPIWDLGRIWLVVLGGALFSAFPEAYATVFSGFYLAFMLLLFASSFALSRSSFAAR